MRLLFLFAALYLPPCLANVVEDGQLLPRMSYAAYTNESLALLCSFDRVVASGANFEYEMMWYKENSSVSRSELPKLSDVFFTPLMRVRGSQVVNVQSKTELEALSFEVIPVSVMRATSILLIKRVTMDHAGFYKCEMPAIRGKVMHFRVEVSPSVLTIEVNETTVSALPNSNISLLCYVGESKPPPTVYWTREPLSVVTIGPKQRRLLRERNDPETAGSLLNPKLPLTVFAYGEVLRFSNFSREDTSKYYCHVENYLAPGSEMPIELHFAESWRIEALYNSLSLKSAGKNLTSLLPMPNDVYILTCRVRTFVKVQFAWYKNAALLQGLTAIDSNMFFHVLVKPGVTESYLVFKKFQPTDKGYYGCRVTDTFGVVQEYGFPIYRTQDESLPDDKEDVGDFSGTFVPSNDGKIESPNTAQDSNGTASYVADAYTEGSAAGITFTDDDGGDDVEIEAGLLRSHVDRPALDDYNTEHQLQQRFMRNLHVPRQSELVAADLREAQPLPFSGCAQLRIFAPLYILLASLCLTHRYY